MTQLKDVARITTSTPTEDELSENAWLVWKSVWSDIDRNKLTVVRTEDYGGGRGAYVHVAVRRHVRRLWPLSDSSAIDAICTPLYEYLRNTGNAKCIGEKTSSKPLWVFATEWRRGSTPRASVRAFKATRAENRLTPQEAGETREPAPVEVRKVEPSVKDEPSETEIDQYVLEVLKDVSEPVVVNEIAYAIGSYGGAIDKSLRRLKDGGKAFSRVETPEERGIRFGLASALPTGGHGRQAALWWLTEPVPSRTRTEVVRGYVSTTTTTPKRWQIVNALNTRWKTVAEIVAMFQDISDVSDPQVIMSTWRQKLAKMNKDGMIERRMKGSNVQYRRHSRGANGSTPEPAAAPAPAPRVTTTGPTPLTGVVVPPVTDMSEAERTVRTVAVSLGVDLEAMTTGSLARRIEELEGENAGLRAQLQSINMVLGNG